MIDGVMTVNSYKGVANVFNSFYKSTNVIDDNRDMPRHIIQNLSGDALSSITINEYEVLATLRTIDATKACLPDYYPVKSIF